MSSTPFPSSHLFSVPRYAPLVYSLLPSSYLSLGFSACCFSLLVYSFLSLPSFIIFPHLFPFLTHSIVSLLEFIPSLPPSLPVYTHPFVFCSYLLSSLINSLHFLSFIQFILSLLPPGFSLPSFIPFPNLFPHSSLFPPPHIFLAPPFILFPPRLLRFLSLRLFSPFPFLSSRLFPSFIPSSHLLFFFPLPSPRLSSSLILFPPFSPLVYPLSSGFAQLACCVEFTVMEFLWHSSV